MIRSRTLTPIILCAWLLVGCYVPPKLPPGVEAPPFKGKGQDGEHYSLLDLTRRGPVLAIFFDFKGTASKDGLEYAKLFHKAYEGRAAVIGIVDLGETTFKDWVKERGAKFPVIPDPDLAIAGRYSVSRAPYAVLVGTNGGIIKRWPHMSRRSLEEINAALSKAIGEKSASIGIHNAPEVAPQGDELRPSLTD
jgi:peroxiredoxin